MRIALRTLPLIESLKLPSRGQTFSTEPLGLAVTNTVPPPSSRLWARPVECSAIAGTCFAPVIVHSAATTMPLSTLHRPRTPRVGLSIDFQAPLNYGGELLDSFDRRSRKSLTDIWKKIVANKHQIASFGPVLRTDLFPSPKAACSGMERNETERPAHRAHLDDPDVAAPCAPLCCGITLMNGVFGSRPGGTSSGAGDPAGPSDLTKR